MGSCLSKLAFWKNTTVAEDCNGDVNLDSIDIDISRDTMRETTKQGTFYLPRGGDAYFN